jgi:prepilin-type N-terminal cleavage/methylation domain-containing protein
VTHDIRSSIASRPARSGFTLIELLLVVAIGGILLGISGSAIGNQVARDRVLRSAMVVEGMLNEASQLAVRRSTPIRVVLSGTALQIQDRATNAVIKQRNFGPGFELRATLAITPTNGIEIFPNGRANAAVSISVSGTNLTQTVSRTATGIVRRQ